VNIAVQALRGLEAIHSAGVIHRDISPDNIMVSTDARGNDLVKIIDLGLVKDLSGAGMELTQAGTFMGKFRYCSPEQAGYLKDAPLDARSDLYSLAQVLYEMLTGLSPFDSESQHGFVLKRLTEEPLPILDRTKDLKLPAILGNVVMKGLERDRDRRYPDAGIFVEALQEVGLTMGRAKTSAPPTVVSGPRSRAKSGARDTKEIGAAAPTASSVRPAGSNPETAKTVSSGQISAPARAGVDRSIGKELTKEEKVELLAKIDSAAAKAQTVPRQVARAEKALKEGRFEEARVLLQKIRESSGEHQQLTDLEARLDDAEAIARRRQQVMLAEQMLERYLLERQQTLANMALDTLLELYPNHPKRDDYASWVGMLADQAHQQDQAEEAFAQGRKALDQGDLATVRQRLTEVEDSDLSGKLAGTLLSELREAEKVAERREAVDLHQRRFEELLEAGSVDEAASSLEALARSGANRVTIDLFRDRLLEAEQEVAERRAAQPFEDGWAAAMKKGSWEVARETALEMEVALPTSSRPGEMFAEVTCRQAEEEKNDAVAAGIRAFDRFLEAGDIDQAELALTVLRRMSPGDPRVDAATVRLDEHGRD